MIKFGVISARDPATGLVRVNFAEDEIVSSWIPVAQPKTLDDEYFVLPDIDDHVAALMDEHCENGVVVGCIFSKAKKPTQGTADNTYVKFKDGTTVVYNRATHKLTVTVGTAVHEISTVGHTIKFGTDTLDKILEDLIDAILLMTVTTPSGPSTLPLLNAASFNAIKTRFATLFAE